MAEYKTHVDEKSGITFVTVTGVLELESQEAYMKSEAYGNRTSRVVADLRQASLSGMSRGSIARLVRNVQSLGRRDIRAAYIFSSGEDFAKGRALIAQLETLGYEGQFGIFTDYDKALDWVN